MSRRLICARRRLGATRPRGHVPQTSACRMPSHPVNEVCDCSRAECSGIALRTSVPSCRLGRIGRYSIAASSQWSRIALTVSSMVRSEESIHRPTRGVSATHSSKRTIASSREPPGGTHGSYALVPRSRSRRSITSGRGRSTTSDRGHRRDRRCCSTAGPYMFSA